MMQAYAVDADAKAAEPRLVARNAAARAAGEILAKLGSLAFFVVMARRLGTVGFGEFQFALALTGALVVVAGFGTDDYLAREVSRDRRRAGRLLADAVAVKVVGGITLLGVAAAIVNVGAYSVQARLVVYVVGVGALLEVVSKSWFSIFQAHQRLELASATLIAQRLVTAAAGIAVLAAGGGVVAAAVVYAAGSLFAILVAELWLRRLHLRRAALQPSGWAALARTSVPIGLITLLGAVLLRLDVTLLSFLGDAAKVGIYAVAFRLVEATQFLGSAFAAAMLPWLARAERSGRVGLARGYGLGLTVVVALLLPVALGLVLFARPIIDLLYGEAFAGAVVPLQLLGMMTLLWGINAFASTLLIARDRPGSYVRLLVPVIVQNIAFNLLLIPRFGARGAAFDAVFSGFLLAALALRQAHVAIGRADLVGAFAGPALGGAAMTALVLLLHLPWLLEATAGVAVYAIVVGAFEWFMRREDARLYLRVLPALPASRSPGGRTTA
jgi:O-antigen/teichoic acid export membrane protein